MNKRAIGGFAGGVALVALVALALVTFRGRGRPAPPTGGTQPTESQPSPSSDGEAQLEARLDAAQTALDRHDWMAVFTETEAVLERAPGHPRALTYQAMVRIQMGQPERALQMLAEARAKAPDSIAAMAYSAMAHVQLGKTREAEAIISEAKRRFPSQAAVLDADFARMKEEAARVGAPPSLPGGSNPHEESKPGASGRIRASDPSLLDEGQTVAGRLEMDPALRATLGSSVTIFVSLHSTAPRTVLALKKVTTGSFPVFFEIGAADSVSAEPLPARVWVEARVDRDGDPATREAGDFVGRLDDAVSLGTFDARLHLRRPGATSR